MAEIYVGTSGWSYPTGQGSWRGHFYPAGKVDELEYYSRFFKVVELNSSFYGPPRPEQAQKWVEKTPPGFIFTAKLWQKFTHPRMFEEATGQAAAISQADVELFRRSLEPLATSGRLGALLAQFPPSFVNDSYGRRILGAVIHTFRDYQLAVELRHRSWSDDPATARLLGENNAAWVQIDEPKSDFSVAQDLPFTADFVYFRFHGRNAEMWWHGNSETRYRYLYSAEEIEELAARVRRAAEASKQVFAFFNNHWQGYAPRNALELMKTLGLTKGPIEPGTHFEL